MQPFPRPLGRFVNPQGWVSDGFLGATRENRGKAGLDFVVIQAIRNGEPGGIAKDVIEIDFSRFLAGYFHNSSRGDAGAVVD